MSSPSFWHWIVLRLWELREETSGLQNIHGSLKASNPSHFGTTNLGFLDRKCFLPLWPQPNTHC